MRRIIGLLLVITIIFSTMTIGFSAEAEGKYIEEAELLKQVNVFKGTGSGFELDRAPSRLEGGVMFVRLLGGEQEAMDKNYSHPFTDVPVWGNPYVGYLWNYGLTKGVSETKFGSKDIMLAKSYITFLLRALDYDDSIGEFNWNDAILKGKDIGLINDGFYTELNESSFLRDYVAKLSYETLKQKLNKSEQTLAEKLVAKGALIKETATEIGVIDAIEEVKKLDTNINNSTSPVSVLSHEDIVDIGADGFSGTDLQIAEQIRNWQINNMIYAGPSKAYTDVSYSMRWNYAFPNTYTVKDMLENMKDGDKYYGVCYNYAVIYASIANYYGLEVRVANTAIKPSEVSDNPFYKATSKGLSLDEYQVFYEWLTKKGINTDEYPYEAVRLVMGETALHYRAEVNIDNEWTRFDQYDSVTDGAIAYEFVVTDWEEGYEKTKFEEYVLRLKNGEDLRGEGYASSYEEFLEGRLIKVETGEVDKFVGITDDAGNTHRASTINEVMQGLGLVPYFNDKADVLSFFENADWVSEEIDEMFEIKQDVENATGQPFYVICDLMIYGELESIEYDVYATQYLGFCGEELKEDIFNNYIN